MNGCAAMTGRWLCAALVALALAPTLAGAELGDLIAARLPAGWRVAPRAEIPRRYTNGPATLAIVGLPTPDGPAGFAQRNLADLQRVLDGFEIVSFDFTFPLGGRSWSRIRYQARLSEKRRTQEVWMTVEGGTGWCVTVGDDQHLETSSGLVRDLLGRLGDGLPRARPPRP